MRIFTFLIILMLSSTVTAEGFLYPGDGVTASNSTQQMQDHICLSLMMFLEARSDGEASQMFHGMVTIQRAINPSRWSNSVCGVIIQPSQYESIKAPERQAILKVMRGDFNAIDEYIDKYYKSSPDLNAWYRANDIAYSLINAKSTNGWLDADHFYAPLSLKLRGLRTPDWISLKDVAMIAGDTHFLKTRSIN